MWNLKYDTNELVYKAETVTDIENRLEVAKQEGWSRMDCVFGISRCQVLYIFYDKVLLHNTRNYTQHPVINHNEKYTYVSLHHSAVE